MNYRVRCNGCAEVYAESHMREYVTVWPARGDAGRRATFGDVLCRECGQEHRTEAGRTGAHVYTLTIQGVFYQEREDQ